MDASLLRKLGWSRELIDAVEAVRDQIGDVDVDAVQRAIPASTKNEGSTNTLSLDDIVPVGSSVLSI